MNVHTISKSNSRVNSRVTSEGAARAGSREIGAFRAAVWNYWKEHGRHDLPWRKTHDPYKILVSEVMLQQTQVPRVIEKYEEFLALFPTVHVLSHAKLAEVLRAWNGLGYNRRGKYLHDAAKAIANEFDGSVNDATRSTKLPGMGPYTRAAVRVFAFNEPHVLIETNIRAAFIHHFFPSTQHVADRQLIMYLEKAAEDQDPREWHWALMDYGSHIKKLHKNPARKSASYVRQSKFEGSTRQVRGAILKHLYRGPSNLLDLPYQHEHIQKAAAQLKRDGLIVQRSGKWQIA